jgi:hypothetical protein
MDKTNEGQNLKANVLTRFRLRASIATIAMLRPLMNIHAGVVNILNEVISLKNEVRGTKYMSYDINLVEIFIPVSSRLSIQ